MILGKLHFHKCKNENGLVSYITYKKSQLITNLTIRPETIELLEEKRAKPFWPWPGQWLLLLFGGFWFFCLWFVLFWYDTNSTGNKKSKNWQVRFLQTRKLLHSKGNSGVKKQPTKWENLLTNHTPTRGTSEIYRNISSRNSINSINEWVEDLNRNFSK